MKLTQRLFTKRALALAILLISLITSLGSVWALVRGGDGPRDATWEKIHREDTLVVGIDPSFPPFGNFGEERPEGLDADLGLALAEELGIANVRFAVLGYDGLYDTLMLGFVDVLISALHPESRREGGVLYTNPYFDAGQVFVGFSATPLPENVEDLAGKTLAVELGSEGDSTARRWLQKSETHLFALTRLISADETIQAVLDGKAEVALVDAISARLFVKNHPELQVSEIPLISDPYVIAVRRSDWRLYLELTQALAELRQKGILDEIIAHWL